MSFTITQAFVQEFSSQVYMRAQQKGSRLRPFVRMETVHGKAKALDRIGATDAVRRTGRHQNTPFVGTPNDRRWIFLNDYEWSDLIDDADKVRLLIDPMSAYQMAAMWAMGRAMDDEIITSADATVMTGENLTDGTIDLPNSQKYTCNDGTLFTRMNLNSLRGIRSMFGVNDVDTDIPIHLACQQQDIDNLLRDTQVTSRDYTDVKALVNGTIDVFYGIQFHRLQRIQTQATALAGDPATGLVGSGATPLLGKRKCIAWAQDGLILGIGEDTKTRISERDDKSYSTQVFVSMSIGAVRMDEQKVVIAFVNGT
jgi:hypothetical protein